MKNYINRRKVYANHLYVGDIAQFGDNDWRCSAHEDAERFETEHLALQSLIGHEPITPPVAGQQQQLFNPDRQGKLFNVANPSPDSPVRIRFADTFVAGEALDTRHLAQPNSLPGQLDLF